MLEIIGLSRKKNIYIANIVVPPAEKLRPAQYEAGRVHRVPPEQFRLIRPAIVVARAHRRQAHHRPRFQNHAGPREVVLKDGVHITALYHPAALLRDRAAAETFEDLKSI